MKTLLTTFAVLLFYTSYAQIEFGTYLLEPLPELNKIDYSPSLNSSYTHKNLSGEVLHKIEYTPQSIDIYTPSSSGFMIKSSTITKDNIFTKKEDWLDKISPSINKQLKDNPYIETATEHNQRMHREYQQQIKELEERGNQIIRSFLERN